MKEPPGSYPPLAVPLTPRQAQPASPAVAALRSQRLPPPPPSMSTRGRRPGSRSSPRRLRPPPERRPTDRCWPGRRSGAGRGPARAERLGRGRGPARGQGTGPPPDQRGRRSPPPATPARSGRLVRRLRPRGVAGRREALRHGRRSCRWRWGHCCVVCGCGSAGGPATGMRGGGHRSSACVCATASQPRSRSGHTQDGAQLRDGTKLSAPPLVVAIPPCALECVAVLVPTV